MKSLLLGCLYCSEGIVFLLGSLLFWSQLRSQQKYLQCFRHIISASTDEWYCTAMDAGSSLPAYPIIAIITFNSCTACILFFYFARKYTFILFYAFDLMCHYVSLYHFNEWRLLLHETHAVAMGKTLSLFHPPHTHVHTHIHIGQCKQQKIKSFL